MPWLQELTGREVQKKRNREKEKERCCHGVYILENFSGGKLFVEIYVVATL